MKSNNARTEDILFTVMSSLVVGFGFAHWHKRCIMINIVLFMAASLGGFWGCSFAIFIPKTQLQLPSCWLGLKPKLVLRNKWNTRLIISDSFITNLS